MKLCHNIKASVFCEEGENEEAIKDSLISLFPFELEKEKIKLKKAKAKGFNARNIIIFEISLKKDRHINSFLDSLNKRLNEEQKELVLRQLNTRLNEELDLFLRFDKEKLIEESKLFLTDKGNCFHIKMSVSAFPKKKEIAEKIIRKIFKVSY